MRHTKAAVTIAHDLLGLEMYSKFTDDQKDIMLSALILHDGLKHGENQSKYVLANHPAICEMWLAELDWNKFIPDDEFGEISSCVLSHMGQWNTDYKTDKEIMPKPKTAMEKFVHQCDYLASRKYLEVNFEAINYEGDRV